MRYKALPFLAMRKGFLIFALCFTFHLDSFASEPVDLGEIVVEEKVESKAPSLDRSAAATVLIPEESKQEAQTIPELLEQSAGVHVKRFGLIDDFSVLSLRGSSSGQVQIYLDDIPLMAAQGTIPDFGIIPLAALERVEIYRGGSPGSLPESTIGGIVILKSKQKPKKRLLSATGTIGSFETVTASASYADSIKRVSPLIVFEHKRSKGDFIYNDDNGTRFNNSDDTLVRRENNDFSSNNLFTKFIIDLPQETTLSISNVFFQKDQGVPGLGNRKSLNAHLTTLRNIAFVAAEKENFLTKNLFFHADLFFDYFNSRFLDPDGEIALTPQDTDDNTYRFGANFRTCYEIGTHQKLTAFVAERSEFFKPYNQDSFPTHVPKSSRHSINTGLQEEIFLFRDRFTIVPSLRVENLFNKGNLGHRSDHQLTAKLGTSLRLVDELYWKSNVYRGFRNPSFFELFGNMGSIQGNPNLKPEKALNIDTGLSYEIPSFKWFDGGKIEATYYRSAVDRLIQLVQTSTFTAMAMNMNKAIIQGVETMASARFANRFRVSASYTYQRAKDASNNPDTRGKYLPGRPKHELYAMVGWREKWLPWLQSDLFCDLRYMSGNFLDTQNLLELRNRSLLGSGLSIALVDKITASFLVQNILNERVSDVVGFPLPGRSYWGTLELKI